MDAKAKDDLFYVCSLIEYIARKTGNTRADISKFFSEQEIQRQLRLAEINHCLSFEQVADELIDMLQIPDGPEHPQFLYAVPSVQAIGRVYQMLVSSVCTDGNTAAALKRVLESFISDEISNFNSHVYYSSPDYLRCSYLAGELLA